MSGTIMQSILKGKILPWQSKLLTTKEYVELSKRIEAEHDFFKQFISDDDRRRFNQYHSLIIEQLAMESDVTDYRMLMIGISIGIEIAEHRQSLICGNGGIEDDTQHI